MNRTKTQPIFQCTQCGADLDIPAGAVFVTCSHCASTLYLDRSQVVFHYTVARTLDAEAAGRTLRRWLAGGEKAKDLDREAEIETPVLRYFPLWRFKVREGEDERFHVEPAAVTTLGLLDGLPIPPGELRCYDPRLAPYLVRPTVPHEAVSRWQNVRETALVHVPLFFFQYRYRGQTYPVAVDGSSGQVFAETYPRRWDLPYRGVAVFAFALLTLVALAAYLLVSPGSEDLGLVYALRCGVQLLAAGLLFFLARQVARKM
ncbi:MAG: hypothetical protein JXM73_25645 [Anaerolineae bacterium]|nr:hypothetical protein [Anaerolineae bacterium]